MINPTQSIEEATKRRVPKTTATLSKIVPLSSIRSERQYARMRCLADKLAVLPEPTRDQEAYFQALTDLMEAYEDKHHPID